MAVARPIPLPAPVMRQVLSSSVMVESSSRSLSTRTACPNKYGYEHQPDHSKRNNEKSSAAADCNNLEPARKALIFIVKTVVIDLLLFQLASHATV